MNELKKVTESEMVIGGVFTLGLDGLCALIDATGVGLAIAPIIQSFATFSITMWLKTKGGTRVKIGKEAVKYAANFLPVLPTVTAIFAVSLSRISPTITTSGSWRRAERNPSKNVYPFLESV